MTKANASTLDLLAALDSGVPVILCTQRLLDIDRSVLKALARKGAKIYIEGFEPFDLASSL